MTSPPPELTEDLPAPSKASGRGNEVLRWLGFLALGVSLGIGVVGATAQESPDRVRVNELHERGVTLQRSRQSDAAIASYSAALALDPAHVPSLYEIGWSYWVLGRWADTVQVWQRVLSLDPDHEDVPRYLPEAQANLDTANRLAAVRTLPELGPDDIPKADGATFRFAFGGDTMMGSPLTNGGLPKDDGAALFDAYRDIMKAADVAFLNLEGTLLDSGDSRKCTEGSSTCYAFRTPVRYVKNLVDAGVDAVSAANNHANDFGNAGRKSTWSTLRSAGVLPVGSVHEPAILDSGDKRIGFLAFATSPGSPDLRDVKTAELLVADLAPQVDLLVVSFHGGAEGKGASTTPRGPEKYLGEDRGDVRFFAQVVVDAGADIVIGHGPHVLRGMEIYKERLIAYSLGNFVTYGGFNLRGENGLTALLLVDLYPDGRFASGRIVSGRQVPPGGPMLDPDHEAARTIARLSSQDFEGSAPPIEPDGRILGPASSTEGGGHELGDGDPPDDDDSTTPGDSEAPSEAAPAAPEQTPAVPTKGTP